MKTKPTETPATARFWVYIHTAWVKLSLRPGQVLRHQQSSFDDEGWGRTFYRWEHCGDEIVEYYCCDGQDCDGPHTFALERSWDGAEKQPRLPDEQAYAPPTTSLGGTDPHWRTEDEQRRDHRAEAAGY